MPSLDKDMKGVEESRSGHDHASAHHHAERDQGKDDGDDLLHGILIWISDKAVMPGNSLCFATLNGETPRSGRIVRGIFNGQPATAGEDMALIALAG